MNEKDRARVVAGSHRWTAQVKNHETDNWRSTYQFQDLDAAMRYVDGLSYSFRRIVALKYRPEDVVVNRRGVARKVGIPQVNATKPLSDHKRFQEIAKNATDEQVMSALQNAQDTPGADDWGTEAESAEFWSVALSTLAMALDC